MDFKKIKTIFIVLFFLTNVFLGINIIYNSYENTVISNELKTQVSNILKNNNIEIDPSVIPEKKEIIPRLVTVENNQLEKKIAADFLGARFEYKDIDGLQTYIYDNSKLVLKNSNYVAFETKQDNTIKTDEKGALAFVSGFMSKIDQKNSKYYILNVSQGNGDYIINVGQKIDNLCVDSSLLTFNISKSNKVSVSGNYIYANVRPADSGLMSDPLNAVLKYLNNSQNNDKIVEISSCYVTKIFLNTTLMPAYKITNQNGVNNYFDIVTGEKIK